MNRRSVFTHFHEILFAIGFKCGYLNFHWVHLCFVIAVLWGRNAANPGNAASSLCAAHRHNNEAASQWKRRVRHNLLLIPR